MQMPGRKFNSSNYRYAFNGKEQDNEISGNGNMYDYGFRIYNPRLGKFLSVDPLSASYPYYTPYQFAGNMPIWAIDLDGLEEMIVTISKNDDGKWGKPVFQKVDEENVKGSGITIVLADKEGGRSATVQSEKEFADFLIQYKVIPEENNSGQKEAAPKAEEKDLIDRFGDYLREKFGEPGDYSGTPSAGKIRKATSWENWMYANIHPDDIEAVKAMLPGGHPGQGAFEGANPNTLIFSPEAKKAHYEMIIKRQEQGVGQKKNDNIKPKTEIPDSFPCNSPSCNGKMIHKKDSLFHPVGYPEFKENQKKGGG